MRQLLVICLLFAITIAGCSCDAGTYVSNDNSSYFIELRRNYTFFIKESWSTGEGKFHKENTQITLKLKDGRTAVGFKEGTKLIDPNGGVWILEAY